jgi:hypothetical protein
MHEDNSPAAETRVVTENALSTRTKHTKEVHSCTQETQD